MNKKRDKFSKLLINKCYNIVYQYYSIFSNNSNFSKYFYNLDIHIYLEGLSSSVTTIPSLTGSVTVT
jgi:hypothetical protein